MSERRKWRNVHATNPIMRKGGVHEKSKGAQRAAAKRTTKQLAGEWRSCSSY